jgi:flagellar hook-associated protein 3 FlgL
MRITNNLIVQSQLNGLQSNLTALNKAQTQATTGKRLTAASDDPSAAATIMQSASSLRAIQQYKTTVSRASDRIAAEDTVLQQLQDILTRAKQIATQQGSDTASPDTRAAAAAEVGGLIQSAVQLGNTKFGNEYLFGGDAATTAPFATTGTGAGVTYTSTNPSGQRNVEIGDGESMAVTHDGTQVFLDSGALAALQKLADALNANDPDAIRLSSDSLDTSFDSVQTIIGDVGARGNRLDMTSANLDAFAGTVTNLKSDLEDVDYETAITDLMSRQNAYQAAMLATTKVMGLTLTDYLR